MRLVRTLFHGLLACACSGCSGLTIPLTTQPPNETLPFEATGAHEIAGMTGPGKLRRESSVWAVHDPLYSNRKHRSTITARAENAAYGLKDITLYVTSGAVVDCSELYSGIPRSVFPCRAEASVLNRTCRFPDGATRGECSYETDLAVDSIVTYRAVATPVRGPTVSSPSITYSSGQPEGRSARPVWWHTDRAPGTSSRSRISLALFPGRKYTSSKSRYLKFADKVTQIVGRAFFDDKTAFAKAYTSNRHLFDLWVGPAGVKLDLKKPCTLVYDKATGPLRSLVDTAAFVHFTNYRDCGSISLKGDGTVSANEDTNGWILVHESGHFMFGLGDEYPGGGHKSCSSPYNLFSSERECRRTAKDLGVSESACRPVEKGSNMFRIDDGSAETMDADEIAKSSFQVSSAAAVRNRFERCRLGHCYDEVQVCVP